MTAPDVGRNREDLVARSTVPLSCLLALLLALLLAVPSASAEDDERPWSEQPYLGLSVRDTGTGLVVGWVRPGPLGGTGFESESGIQRGDNVVTIDGEVVDAQGFKTLVKAKRPGDELTLVYRRSPEADADGSVPRGGAGGEATTLVVALGARADWAGTVGRGLGERSIPAATEGAFEARILEAAAEVGVRGGDEGVGGALDALLPYLARVQEDALDANSLPAVVKAFRRPLSVDAVEEEVAAAARAAAGGELRDVEALVRLVLDLPDAGSARAQTTYEESTAAARSLVRFCGQVLEGYQGWGKRRAPAELLVRALRDSVYVMDDHARSHVATISKHGTGVDVLLGAPLALLHFAPADWEARAREVTVGEVPADVPDDVRAFAEGDLLWHGVDALGKLAVVGGQGPNRYDMSRVAAVYDVGGDDVYTYGVPASPIAMRVVIDLEGDDLHESSTDFEGPATAVYGLSYLDDRAGNDVYRTQGQFGIGAGCFGLGVLRDRAGNDVYENLGERSGWAMGVGFYGAGLVIDQAGSDVYRGEKLVQGVGGPRGLGAILDVAGNDLYVADGPSFGSVYGTPAVYVGMSQGFGIGVRGYAAGGVGAIYDLAGNDRYVAGEFSQAGGYYFGLGILHDAQGRDLYHGNRYGQAFAAHQAVGVLVDDEGDDTYWSMTAASQAGIWDQSIGLLLDRQGNDTYRCDGLGQGGASMQALAILLDLGGDDHYSGRGGSVQGQGGGNRYHYDADKVFSFSALLDLGGGHDSYSAPGRGNDKALRTGTFKAEDPAASNLYGLFVDR